MFWVVELCKGSMQADKWNWPVYFRMFLDYSIISNGFMNPDWEQVPTQS